MNELKLKAKIVECGMNVDTLSCQIGMDKSTFYRKVKQNGFTTLEANAISKKLNLDEKEILSIFFENIFS